LECYPTAPAGVSLVGRILLDFQVFYRTSNDRGVILPVRDNLTAVAAHRLPASEPSAGPRRDGNEDKGP